MATLDARSPETLEAIEQGVANAPSAAPEVHVIPMRRSPIYVGLSAGLLGVAPYALVGHRTGPQFRGRSVALAHAQSRIAVVAAAMASGRGPPLQRVVRSAA